MHRIITKTKTYQYIINYIIDNYFKAVRDIAAHLGSDEERNTYVLYFNKRLKEKCIEYGFHFFDIYDHYTDEEGFLRRDLSDGNVHIGNGEFIVKKLASL